MSSSSRAAVIAVSLIAVVVFAATLHYGSFVAGGSDSFGYLSQAQLWARGSPVTQEPLITKVDWPQAEWTFSPLGYKPGLQKGTIVPVYSVGYPIVMAAFQRVFGRGAELYVVPLAAVGLVLCTALMGYWIGGHTIGVLSSLLLATSPSFVLQSLQPMSDVPVAFWWTLAAVLALSRSAVANAGAAPAAALAVLTRPNLFPLGLLLAVVALLTNRRHETRYNWRAGFATVLGIAIGAAWTGYFNTMFFGAPYVSGYGAPRDLYSSRVWWANLRNYIQWLIQSETPLVLLSFVGAIALMFGNSFSRKWAIYALMLMAGLLCSYLFYAPFQDWTYVRFLLPAYPFLFIAVLSVTRTPLFGGTARRKQLVLATLIVAISVGHIQFIIRRQLLDTKVGELRYVEVGEYVRRYLPANAVLISHQHSGSIRYYSGRTTLRYDWLMPGSLDDAVNELRQKGYQPYFVLEKWEEPAFQARFGRDEMLARLDWHALMEFRKRGIIRIYDPADRR